jgi:hypothetical protein
MTGSTIENDLGRAILLSSTRGLVKLHLRDRVQAVIFACQLGLVTADQPGAAPPA